MKKIFLSELKTLVRQTIHEVTYSSLTPDEKFDYNKRNSNLIQNKIRPFALFNSSEEEVTPKIQIDPTYFSYSISEKSYGSDDLIFSLKMNNPKNFFLYMRGSKVYDFNEVTLRENIKSFLNLIKDYVTFLDDSTIENIIRKIYPYLYDKKPINTTISL